MHNFRRVGQEVPFGVANVGIEDVQPIHDLALDGALLAARSSEISFADDYDKVKYGFYFRPIDDFEETGQHRFATVQSIHMPNAWHMALNLRTFTPTNRYSNKLIRYSIDTYGDEVMLAKKEVYLILGQSTIVITENEPYNEVTSQRKTYERPLVQEDCAVIVRVLGQTAGRAAVTRR